MPPGEGGGENGILEHVPFTNQHAQHEAAKHKHPLAALLNKEGTHISLDLVDAGEDTDQLIPTSQESTSFKSAYTAHYNLKGFDGQVLGAPPPDFDQNKQKVVGSWNTQKWHKEKLKFEFRWGKWGYDPDKQEWQSDVKLLGGEHSMEFVVTDESEGQISDSNGRKYVDFTLSMCGYERFGEEIGKFGKGEVLYEGTYRGAGEDHREQTAIRRVDRGHSSNYGSTER